MELNIVFLPSLSDRFLHDTHLQRRDGALRSARSSARFYLTGKVGKLVMTEGDDGIVYSF